MRSSLSLRDTSKESRRDLSPKEIPFVAPHFRAGWKCHGFQLVTLLLLAILVFIPNPCHAQANQPAVQQETIPYIPVGKGAPAVDVVFNGTVKARMLVDSGSTACFISDQLATELGLANGPFLKWQQPLIVRGESLPLVMISSMSVGNFQVANTAFAILDSSLMGPIDGVDGIIGANALAVIPAFFDFQKHEITLFSKSPSDSDLKSVGMDGAQVVPVHDKNGDLRFLCPVSVISGDNEAVDQLHIDTGSVTTVFSKKAATNLGLTRHGSTLRLPTVDQDIRIDAGWISGFSIAGLQTKAFAAYYSIEDLPPGSVLPLGVDVLSHYKILLDFSKKVMYIKPADNATLDSSPSNTR